jgi:hypothetical protein
MVVLSISFASLANSLWLLSILVVIGGLGAAIMHPEAGKPLRPPPLILSWGDA